MNAPPLAYLRVVKVGGSLFDLPDLEVRIRNWLAAQPPARTLLLAGGGPLVQAVREEHSRSPLDEQTAHWRCIALLDQTARLLKSHLPSASMIDSTTQVPTLDELAIFSPSNWLQEHEPRSPGTILAESWQTTSDAIAGRLAIVLEASELVLLKSAEVAFAGALNKRSAMSEQLTCYAERGLIDPMLATLHRELPLVRLVNLRSSGQCVSQRG